MVNKAQKLKLNPHGPHINFRSKRQSPILRHDDTIRNAFDENNSVICLGYLNKNFKVDLPQNISDIFVVNGLQNIIYFPTHFDIRTGNRSLLDPILITDSVPVIESDTIPID